jgi:hypothetical protein
MTRKIPLTLALAALVGFAAPTLAAETHAAKHDPQVATSTAKPKAAPSKETKKETKSVKGRHHAKASKAKTTVKTPAAQPTTPAK